MARLHGFGFAGALFAPAPTHPDQILPHMLMHLDIPAFVVGLFCAGALSASMSTGDALLHAGASVAVEDGIRPYRRLDDRQQRLLMRWLVLAIGAIAYFFALYEGVSLVVLLLSSYGIIAFLQRGFYKNEHESRLINPDFVALARAYGAQATRVDSPAGLAEALRGALASGKMWLIELAATFPEPPFWLY